MLYDGHETMRYQAATEMTILRPFDSEARNYLDFGQPFNLAFD